MKKYPILILFILPFIAFSISGCDNNTNAQQVVEVIDGAAFDFVQNVVSGSIGEQVSENEYLIELQLSPNTVYTSDIPIRFAGSITTESFYSNFNLNFPDLFPNAILSINEGEEVVAIPFEMKNPNYDPLSGILELTVSPLDITQDAGGSSINLTGIDEIDSSFGQSSLFIDDAVNSCQGLTQGKCSSGNSIASCDDNSMNCCFIDGQCNDVGAVCNGGSSGVCSVTEEDCLSDQCCTSGGISGDCLDAIPLPL